MASVSNKRKRNSSTDFNHKSVSNKPPNSANKHWSMGLLSTLADPNSVVFEDELVTVIKDKYPKAKQHFLILPKESISSLKVVTADHYELLDKMHKVAKKLTEDHKFSGHNFLIGYHAEPSMVRLHLHVISDDLDSQCLKTKKHWNSFTTKFFLHSEDVLISLKNTGKPLMLTPQQCKVEMAKPLKCHKCDHVPKNMPALKEHLLKH